jgi:hypothetical protein
MASAVAAAMPSAGVGRRGDSREADADHHSHPGDECHPAKRALLFHVSSFDRKK